MTSLAKKDQRRVEAAEQALAKVNSATVQNKQKAKSKNNPRNSPKSKKDSLLTMYEKTLSFPLKNPPVRIGFNTMTRSYLASGYRRFTELSNSAYDSVLIVMNPDALCSNNTDGAGAGLKTNRLSNWLSINRYLLTTGASWNTIPPANIFALQSIARTYRTVSSGFRVSISSPVTSASPVLGLQRFNGCTTTTELDSYDPTTIQSNIYSEIGMTEDGTRQVSITWLPSDPQDFCFNSSSGASNGAGIINPLALSVTGMPVGTRIFIEAISHIEYQSGSLFGNVIQGQEGTIDEDSSLLDIFPSVDSMWNTIKSVVGALTDAYTWTSDHAPYLLNPILRDHMYITEQRVARIMDTTERKTVAEIKSSEREQSGDSLIEEAENISDEISILESQGKLSSNYKLVLKQKLDCLLDEISRVDKR